MKGIIILNLKDERSMTQPRGNLLSNCVVRCVTVSSETPLRWHTAISSHTTLGERLQPFSLVDIFEMVEVNYIRSFVLFSC